MFRENLGCHNILVGVMVMVVCLWCVCEVLMLPQFSHFLVGVMLRTILRGGGGRDRDDRIHVRST